MSAIKSMKEYAAVEALRVAKSAATRAEQAAAKLAAHAAAQREKADLAQKEYDRIFGRAPRRRAVET